MKIYIPLAENPPTITAQQKGETIEYTWKRGKQIPYIKHYEKDEVAQVRHWYEIQILKSLRRSKESIPRFEGSVRYKVTFIFTSKRKKDIGSGKATKPDCDNMNKLLQDVLEDMGFFSVGDQQISHTEIIKHYGSCPGIVIEIEKDSEVYDDLFAVQT